ncbi:hypothetical protein BsWGS_15214 [Bradybaena similaris]
MSQHRVSARQANMATHDSSAAQEETTSLLLPPSEFEKPLARDLERPVHRLQAHFKYGQETLQHNVTPLCTLPRKDYVDELIQRQAGEIVQLRSEAIKCRVAYEQDAADWKASLSTLQEEHAAEVRLLERNLANVEEEHGLIMSRLTSELERALADKQAETAALREKLDSTTLLLEKRVHDLEAELTSLRQVSDSSRRQLEAELREKTRVCEDQFVQISNLKSYICNSEETHKPALAWKMEKEAVDNKLKIAEAENHKLTSTVELLEVRFQALRDILSIQEQELDKSKGGGTGKVKQASSLLTRWREKVFSLLVQQRMSDILHKRDMHGLRQQMRDLEDDKAASEAQVQLLQHSLIDKDAQLQIEVNRNQRLQQEYEHTQQVAVCLDDQSRRDCHSLELLSEFVHRSKNQMDKMMNVLEEKASDLKMCGQRISFASNRMEFIKTQLIRKSALSFGRSRDTEGSPPSVAPGDGGDSRAESRDSERLVHQELVTLTQERDALAAQVRADAEHWSAVLADSRCQYAGEIRSLKAEIEVLEQQLQHKSQECRDLSEEVELLKETVAEKDGRVKQLQTDLARHERGIESVLTDQRLKDDIRWREQLADLERKLNTAKREHAKAVVSLRQTEQSQQRRLQQAEDLLQTTEHHLARRIEQLEAKLRSVEKERNLMMATLRQEGLLGRLKSDRGQFVQLTGEEENCSPDVLQDGGGANSQACLGIDAETGAPGITTDTDIERDRCHRKGPTFHHEPVQLVLEDLKSLTAAVFDDEEEAELEDNDVEGNKEENTQDCKT